MAYESLEDCPIRTRRTIERLETEKLLFRDENSALKAETKSYQDELARIKVSHEDKLARIRVLYHDQLARTRTAYEVERAQMREEIATLEGKQILRRDEVRALNVAAHAYQDELRTLTAEKLRQQETIRALEVKANVHNDELVQIRKEMGELEAKRVLQEEEIHTLRVGALQETPARHIGKEVRLRFLEKHRRLMGRRIGELGYQRIKCGDRAAHRGRPVVDALLCLTGEITDRAVFPDLYGVKPEIMRQWADVPEIVEVTGFRASLQSEGRLTAEFQTPFERLLEISSTHLTPTELKAAFGQNKVLQQLHGQLQNCYDKIVAANPRCKNSMGSDPKV